jgi:23S rRNA pseudouridine1911/1915/1917 synthase
MPKALTAEIMAILRQFNVAGELSSRRSITQVTEKKPRDTTRIISFIFERTKYHILIDNAAEDDELYIMDQLRLAQPELKGALITNPNDPSGVGLRFKWKDTYLFQVSTGKQRLDVELVGRYPQLSRSTIQKYIKDGRVSVNGQQTFQTKLEVSPLDDIAIEHPDAPDHSDREVPILYIDNDVIVINKPAGMLTHSKGVLNDEFTAAEFVRRYTTHALETNRPGIIHRLDRDTSGVLIAARHDDAAAFLKKQFADRKVIKEYVAVVDGVPKVEKALIDLPIGRNPSAPSTFRVDPAGKSAQTTYEVLGTSSDTSLVKLWPKTRRTHQLRVHLQYINTPIVGDKVYGHSKADRLYLHAFSLDITLPQGARKVFGAPIPESFEKKFPGVLGA